MRSSLILVALLLACGGCDSDTSPGGLPTSNVPPDPAEPKTAVFRVAVVPSSSYPDGTVVFLINGEQEAEITLTRGGTYVFQMADTPEQHPFHLSTSSTGGDGGANAWPDGVTGNFASGNEILTFVVPSEAPDLLYYQCSNHELMGWKINIGSL